MSYPQLIQKCAKAIAENRCMGCQALEDINFKGNPNCIYNKTPSAEESIKQIKLNLRNGEKMKYKLDKNKFYEQLKCFTNKYIPISIQMPLNKESRYSIILDEFRTSVGKITHDYTLQIYDRTKTGYEKYMCKDINFNLINENISSDYQLYKFILKKVNEILEAKDEI